MSTETNKLPINKYKEIALKIAKHFKDIIVNSETPLTFDKQSKNITDSNEYKTYMQHINTGDEAHCKKYITS